MPEFIANPTQTSKPLGTSPFISNPTLAPRLLAHIAKHANRSDAALVDAYLGAGPDAWLPVERMVLQLLSSDASLAAQLHAHIQEHGGDMQSALTPVVVAWSTQENTDVPLYCTKLFPQWERSIQGQLSSLQNHRVCQSANAFMAMFIPLVPHLAPHLRDDLIESVAIDILDVGHRWPGAGLPSRDLLNFAAGLTLLVHQKPEDPSQEHYYSHAGWRTKMSMYPTDSLAMLDVLQTNNLSPEVILQAYRQGNTDTWVAHRDAFMPYLPEDEHERLLALPNESTLDLEDWMEDGYIERKRRLVQTFCPTLYPLIDLFTSDKDWCSHATITAVAASRTRQDAVLMPLPDNLDIP